MLKPVDVAVVGGGPAGLAAALFAVRAGLEPVVFEPRSGVIDKACGEGLMPGAVHALAQLGIDPPGYDLHGIRYVQQDTCVDAGFRMGAGRGVRRTALHDTLRQAVAGADIQVRMHRVRHVEQSTEQVLVDGVPARYVIAADGLHSPVRDMLLSSPRPAGPARYGLRQHFHAETPGGYVEVHWGATAEAYVTPVAHDQVGVALLSSVKAGFDEGMGAFPQLKERLGPAVTSVRGAGPLRQDVPTQVVGRVLLVGDAGGYVDALTGEGISLGVAQAEAAVRAIREGRPAMYAAQWRRITRRYRWLTGALLGAAQAHPLRHRIVPAAATLPVIFSAAVNTLAHPAGGVAHHRQI